MAISATFTADFSKFNQALADAKAGLKNFEQPVKGVQQSLERMAKSFAGVEIKKQAEIAAAAVEKVGGAAKLTASEQKKLTSTIDEALAKYKALGESAPASLITLRGALTKIADEEQRIKDGADHLKKLAGDTAGVAAPAEAGALSFGKLTSSVLTGQAAYDALRTTGRLVVQFLGDSVQSYANAEAAQKKLTTALKAQGTATPEVIGQFNDLAATFQNTTVYSDDLINEMEALLTQVGSVMPQDMGKALTAATDLASGLGIDLQQATMLVGKTLEGNAGALGRYGIKLDESRVKAEGMDYVLGELEKRFGGQAQAQLDTYAGRLEHLANSWDNVKEAIGKVLVTNPLVTAGLREIDQAAVSSSTGADKAGSSLGALWVTMGQSTLGGSGLALIEDYVDGLNEIARAKARVDQVPTPSIFSKDNGAIKAIGDGVAEFDRLNEAQDRAKKAAEAHAAAIQKLRDQMSGAALLKDLQDNIAAFNGLPKPIQDSKIAQDALADAYVRALPAFENASDAMLRQTSYAAGLAASLGRLEPPIENAANVLRGLGQTLSIDTFFGGMDSVGFEAALVRPFVSLKTEGSTVPTSVLFPIKQGMSDLAKSAIADLSQMNTAIQGSFAQMLLGAKGFKDGFLDIWNSIKAGIARILTDILGDFVNRFIKGLISAMSGSGFTGAFSGMLGGIGGIGGGGGGFGLPGLGGLIPGIGGGGFAAPIGANIAPGSMFAGMPGAATTPWWQTGLGGGAIGAGAGMFVGGMIGGRTGNVWGGGLSGAGTGAAVGAMFGGPVGAVIGGIGGGLWGWYKAKQANKKANDNRDSYLAQFGGGGTGEGSGFLNLASTLTKATGEAGGGSLFKDLIKANDPQELAEAIAKVNAKLEEYSQKTTAAKAAEDQQAAAIAKTSEELKAKTEAIQAQMQGLDDELKKLDASEAPEKHMGTVEKRARERIAKEKEDLQKQLDAAKEAAAAAIEAIKAAGTASSDVLKEAGAGAITDLGDGFVHLGDLGKEEIDKIRLMLEDLGKNLPPIHREVVLDYPEGPDTPPGPPSEGTGRPPGFAGGTPGLGFVNFGKESLVRLHGREAVIPAHRATDAAAAWGGGSSQGGAVQSVTILEIDKREIGRAIADVLPGELRRLGVRVRA